MHLLLLGYYYQPDDYKDFLQASGGDQCYSSGLFRELQLPSGNARVHPLRINPLGAEDRETRSPSPHEHRCRKDVGSNTGSSTGSNKRSASAVDNNSKKNHRFEMPKLDPMLPCDSISTASSDGSVGYGVKKGNGAYVMMLDGSEGELETEHVNFQEYAPKFSNSVDLSTEKDHETEIANLLEQFPSFKDKLGLKHFIGTSKNIRSPCSTSPCSGTHDTLNGDVPVSPTSKKNPTPMKEKDKSKRRRSNRSATSDDETTADLRLHMVTLESQIQNQVKPCSFCKC